MARKDNKIRLVSTDPNTAGHFYTTIKNNKNTPNKLEVMKFDPSPKVRKHVLYKEAKIK